VEDHEDVRKYVAAALRAYGYRVIQAMDADEAVLVCERNRGRVDLLLTDVVMPNQSGKELASRLGEICPRIGVLFMSGYADGEVMRHGFSAKGASFLQKPFSAEQLALKVREILTTKGSPGAHSGQGE